MYKLKVLNFEEKNLISIFVRIKCKSHMSDAYYGVLFRVTKRNQTHEKKYIK